MNKYLESLKTAKNRFLKFRQLYKKSENETSLFQSMKYFYKWEKSFNEGRSPLNDHKPWIVYEALDYLDKIIRKDMIVFEYGSGGSSAYFSSKTQKVVSVEHDNSWLEKTKQEMNESSLNNWEGVFIKPNEELRYDSLNYSDPDNYMSIWNSYRGKIFYDYASYIDRFDDNFFDIVLIDGRARNSCFIHAITKIKRDGYLILDNSERDRYKYIHECMTKEKWIKKDFFGPGPYVNYEFWQTTIWKRP